MRRSFEITSRSKRCILAKQCENLMELGLIELPVAAENEGA
jgi:hypothetical protein